MREGWSDDARPPLDPFLHPGSIAVVGASADRATIAGLLFGNLLDSGFGGVVLPVNRHHSEIRGIPAYPDLVACPVRPDLVVVCVPAHAVTEVVAQAGHLGIGAVCVISAGFAEVGPEGTERQAQLLATASTLGVRLVRTQLHGDPGRGRGRPVQRHVQPHRASRGSASTC